MIGILIIASAWRIRIMILALLLFQARMNLMYFIRQSIEEETFTVHILNNMKLIVTTLMNLSVLSHVCSKYIKVINVTQAFALAIMYVENSYGYKNLSE